MTNALKAAGWIPADKTNKDAVVSALLATLQKNVYVAVPMSMSVFVWPAAGLRLSNAPRR